MSGKIANSDHMVDPFPGIQWRGTPSPGSQPDRPAPPDDEVPPGDSGIPGVGTIMSLAELASPEKGTATTQPGQMAGLNNLMGFEDPQELGWTGAGGGHTDAWDRKPYQASPGKNG